MDSGGVSGGGGSSEGEKKKPPEGETKVKRKMKTASQLEILEKTYASLLHFLIHFSLSMVFFLFAVNLLQHFLIRCCFSGNVPV